jgi:hypothetical protein
MASKPRTMTVNFVGRTDQLDKAYKRVNKGSQNMATTLSRGLRTGMVAFAGIGAAAAGFVALTKPMVDMAADVGESMSKNKVLFGEAANSVTQFAETAATDFGLSKRAALEAAGNFGALTHAMGMSGEQGSDMSITMVKLAADMASFNNASPEETLTALAAGLRGENEPLRRFGVLLDAATTKQKALEMGLIENTKGALDPATKALASYHLILEQSTVQQGDFQRTSDGLANSQRILAAQWEDLQTQLGEALLPLFTDITHWLVNEGIPNAQKFIDVWKAEGPVKAITKMSEALATAFGEYGLANTINAGKLLLAGFVSMIEAVRDAVNDALLSPFRLFDELAPGLINDIKNAFSPLFGWLEGMASTAAGWWDTIFGGGQESDIGTPVGEITTPGFFGAASSGLGGFNPNVGPDPLFGMGATATDAEIAAEMQQFEEMATAAAATVATPPRTPGATLADPRAAAFQGASLAGAAHTINVNINAPAVTTAEVNAAVANGFKNDAMLLESLYFI